MYKQNTNSYNRQTIFITHTNILIHTNRYSTNTLKCMHGLTQTTHKQLINSTDTQLQKSHKCSQNMNSIKILSIKSV